MQPPKLVPNVPTGLAFEIADLMMLQAWAETLDTLASFGWGHRPTADRPKQPVQHRRRSARNPCADAFVGNFSYDL